jgi:hypothetical protein
MQTISENGGPASRIHQDTALQKRKKGDPPLEFINFKLEMGGLLLEFINLQPQKRGSASRIHQHQPRNEGSASKNNFYWSSGTSCKFICILGTNYFTILMCNPAPILPPYIGNPRIVSRINSLPLCWIRDQSQLRSKKIRENVCISACRIQWKLWVNPPIFTWAHFHVIFL